MATEIIQINTQDFTSQEYEGQDLNLIPTFGINTVLSQNSYIEYFIYDVNQTLLTFNYNFTQYKVLNDGQSAGQNNNLSQIEIDPEQVLIDSGFDQGIYITYFNFFNKQIGSNLEQLYIKEISSDRTEIRLASTTLTNEEIESAANALIDEMNNSTYYVDYLLNFGNNEQYVAVNVFLNRAIEGYEILFKLYQPLPLSVQEKQTLWVVEEKVTPYVFDINLDRLVTPAPPPTLRGPNFDIEIPNNGTVSTAYNTYNNLVMGLQSLQSSSYHRIINLIATQSININVDYSVSESSDFGNFVFFGSAYQRTSNFYTKAKQIEDYNNLITKYTPYVATTASLLTEINKYSSSITNIISQFDGYESYLYFESSSYAWPKSGSLKPFKLLSTGSATVLSWYSTLTGSALDYDANNYDNLETSDPSLLLNLSWLGRPDLGFWLAVFDVKPSVNYYKKIITTNTINQIEKTVTVSYTELDLTPEELDAKRTKIKSMNVPIRDSYLKLTDFTQLADAPISDQAKTDFLTFRQQLRSMFDIEDYSQLTWPTIPSSAPNITIPPFPPINLG